MMLNTPKYQKEQIFSFMTPQNNVVLDRLTEQESKQNNLMIQTDDDIMTDRCLGFNYCKDVNKFFDSKQTPNSQANLQPDSNKFGKFI